MTAEHLLFTGKDGKPISLEDLIAAGLDADESERVPGLVELLAHGAPNERLLAAIVLTSWAHAEGFAALQRWASEPEAAPWHGDPVSFDRHFGVDDAFERLADAVWTSRLADASRAQQAAALSALLGIHHRKHFGRMLATILLMDPDLASLCAEAIRRAADASMAAIDAPPEPFDIGTQTAALLGPLATQDDERAARHAETLLLRAPNHTRALRELAYALRNGQAATLAVLERLAQSSIDSVREEAESSLAARRARSTPPAR
ncbi:Hypothetical protein A7982_09911 [Minicystis rosea]|nr:Hypothetical protein A7982_09911 [Minicystis rosea]